MQKILSACLAIWASVGAANAALVTFSFSGSNNPFNPGLVGVGPFSGSITFDTDVATGGPRFASPFADIDITINGVQIRADGSCTDSSCNSLTQVVVGGSQDAFVGGYSGPFESTGQGYEVRGISFEIRTDADLFSDTSLLFDNLSPGDAFNLPPSYIRLSVGYEGFTSSDSTILTPGYFDTLSVSVSGPTPVPLPAGFPLLSAGLGLLGLRRRLRAV